MRQSRLESSSFMEKQRKKKAHSVKLEMKGLFLRRDFQNLTMMSTQELNYLETFFNGPELVKLSLKKIKCKKILSGTKKLKSFWNVSFSFISNYKNKNEQVSFWDSFLLEKNLDFLKFWLDKLGDESLNTKKHLRKCLKSLLKKKVLNDSKRNEVAFLNCLKLI